MFIIGIALMVIGFLLIDSVTDILELEMYKLMIFVLGFVFMFYGLIMTGRI